MPKFNDDFANVVTSLAGLQISCHSDSATAPMLQSFAPTATDLHKATSLHISIALDEHGLDEALGRGGTASTHMRRGNDHAWINEQPRRLQTLVMDTPSHARLLVDETFVRDAAVMARPVAESIEAWATQNDVYPLHASAVEFGGNGVLFVGESGRGKTTTALALATRGWALIADDRCFLTDREGDYELHGLYASTVVTKEVADRNGELIGEHIGVTREGKIAARLPPHMKFTRNARLRGVVILNHQHDEPYSLTKLGTRAAISAWQEALLPTQRLLGSATSLFSLLINVSQQIPIWRLNLGWEFRLLDRALRQLTETDYGRTDL